MRWPIEVAYAIELGALGVLYSVGLSEWWILVCSPLVWCLLTQMLVGGEHGIEAMIVGYGFASVLIALHTLFDDAGRLRGL